VKGYYVKAIAKEGPAHLPDETRVPLPLLNNGVELSFSRPYALLWEKIAFFCLPEVFCNSKICDKCVSNRVSAPDPAERAHDAPPDLLVG